MRLVRTLTLAAVCAGAALAATAGADEGKVSVDPDLWTYTKVPQALEGNLNSVGSDTMNNLVTLWAEGFARHYPGVRVQVEGKGSSTAPPALIEGTAQFGPMSRAMKDKEVDAFEEKFGYKPTQLKTSMDALAVFVHRDNPLRGLTMTQVDSIFSSTRKRGGGEVGTWGDLGLTGDWATKPINLYGRNSASGTYGFFKDTALNKGDFKDSVKEQPGSAAVVQGVTEDLYAVGYSGVNMVPLGEDSASMFEANMTNVVDGTYPLGRFLYLYVNKAPNKQATPLVREFVRFVFSREGQEIVVKDGYLPLDERMCAKMRALVD